MRRWTRGRGVLFKGQLTTKHWQILSWHWMMQNTVLVANFEKKEEPDSSYVFGQGQWLTGNSTFKTSLRSRRQSYLGRRKKSRVREGKNGEGASSPPCVFPSRGPLRRLFKTWFDQLEGIHHWTTPSTFEIMHESSSGTPPETPFISCL